MVVHSEFLDASGILELCDKGIDVLDDFASGASGWLGNFDGFHGWRDVHAQLGRVGLLDLLLLRLHNVGQGGVARLVDAQVDGEDGRGGDLQRLQTAINLTLNSGLIALMIQLKIDLKNQIKARKTHRIKLGGLGPVELTGDHGGSLTIVGVNRLLADDHQVGLFLLDHLGEDF